MKSTLLCWLFCIVFRNYYDISAYLRLTKKDIANPYLVVLKDSRFRNIHENKEGVATRHKWTAPNVPDLFPVTK